MAERPEILLITENKTVLLKMGRDGKFSAKSSAWEENKVVLEGEEIVIPVSAGQWFIVKWPAQGAVIGPGTPAKTGAPAPRLTMFCNAVTGGVAPQPLVAPPPPGPVARYQTDLTDADWRVIAPHLPKPCATGRPREWPMREIVNGIFYVMRAGCPWRLLPSDARRDNQRSLKSTRPQADHRAPLGQKVRTAGSNSGSLAMLAAMRRSSSEFGWNKSATYPLDRLRRYGWRL
jgi:transposase